MNLILSRLSENQNTKLKEAFITIFSECPEKIRKTEYVGFSPSSAYTQALVQIALKRASEFFIVKKGNEVVGRAGVTRFLSNKEIACLGFFECAEPGDSAQVLIDAASQWAREQGCKMLYGPVDINTWFSYRFLVSATDASRFSWEPVQPPEYPALFQKLGFETTETYRTRGVDFGTGAAIPEILAQTGKAYESALSLGYVFEPFTDSEGLLGLLSELYEVCMSAFPGAFLFEPLPPPVFQMLYMSAAHQRDFSFSHLVRDPSGSMVGFLFAFLDRDQVVIKTVAISPQLRGMHLSSALTYLALKVGNERGLKKYISALVRDGNNSEHLFNKRMLPDSKIWEHEYVLYGKKL